jgi:hypothetical protein
MLGPSQTNTNTNTTTTTTTTNKVVCSKVLTMESRIQLTIHFHHQFPLQNSWMSILLHVDPVNLLRPPHRVDPWHSDVSSSSSSWIDPPPGPFWSMRMVEPRWDGPQSNMEHQTVEPKEGVELSSTRVTLLLYDPTLLEAFDVCPRIESSGPNEGGGAGAILAAWVVL